MVKWGNSLKGCPRPSLAGLLGAPPMGTLSQDYGNICSCALLEVSSASAATKVHQINLHHKLVMTGYDPCIR